MRIDMPFEADWIVNLDAGRYALDIGPYSALVEVKLRRTEYRVDRYGIRIYNSVVIGSDREIEIEEAQKSCEDAIRDDVISRRLAAARAAQSLG